MSAAVAEAPASGAMPPPVPWPRPLQTAIWVLAPTFAMEHLARRLGSTFTLDIAPGPRLLAVVSTPRAARDVFTAAPSVAPSATGQTPLGRVLGPHSVLTLVGDEHLRQRKLLLPPFHGERMREYVAVVRDATRRDMASWPRGRPMRLHPHMQAITLEVILRAVFGVQADRMAAMRTAIGDLFRNPITLAAVQVLRPSSDGRAPGRLGRSLERLDSLIHAEIAARRQVSDLAERPDILSLLLQARDETGAAMSDRELRDELVTLLLAGHETTATAASWAVERLIRHPDVLRRLLEDLDEDYLDAVIHETLRVRPVVPSVVRTLTEPLGVDGRLLPAGARVLVAVHLVNRDPELYPEPDRFRPERFLGRAPETYAWVPFGGGIRRCIGASFALTEMRSLLRTVLEELEPSLPRATPWRRGEPPLRRAVTVAPMLGTRVVWRARQG